MASLVERTKVSVPTLAKEWGVSSAKIAAFIKSGELRAINIATRAEQRPRYLIDRADVAAFERARVVIPEPQPARRLRRQTPPGVREFV